jgi:hypothetical protein
VWRDAILLALRKAQGAPITLPDIKPWVHTEPSPQDAVMLLQEICVATGQGWVLKHGRDPEFAASHPGILEEQEIVWREMEKR